jgi:hypothetical protein
MPTGTVAGTGAARPSGASTLTGVRRLLLSPKWLAVHVLVVAAVLVQLRLGLWQWHRSQSSSGGIQNWAYAFQWPLFALFTIVLWVKTLRIELAGRADETGQSPRPLSRMAVPAMPPPEIRHHEGVRIGITTDLGGHFDEDEEVRVYNAYLDRLNAGRR